VEIMTDTTQIKLQQLQIALVSLSEELNNPFGLV
jgi:hypothetical protein